MKIMHTSFPVCDFSQYRLGNLRVLFTSSGLGHYCTSFDLSHQTIIRVSTKTTCTFHVQTITFFFILTLAEISIFCVKITLYVVKVK